VLVFPLCSFVHYFVIPVRTVSAGRTWCLNILELNTKGAKDNTKVHKGLFQQPHVIVVRMNI